jgi:hypothetical protein
MCSCNSKSLIVTLIAVIAFWSVSFQPGIPSGPEKSRPDPSDQSSPEKTVEAFMQATRAGDWKACAGLMHTDALSELKRVFVAMASMDTTDEFAEYFFGSRDEDVINGMTGRAAFARLMNVMETTMPGLSSLLASAEAKIIGSVPEGELIHVVYRQSFKLGEKSASTVGVVTLKREGSDWRALLTADMEEMLKGLQNLFKQ